jgi:hypothetical protein
MVQAAAYVHVCASESLVWLSNQMMVDGIADQFGGGRKL